MIDCSGSDVPLECPPSDGAADHADVRPSAASADPPLSALTSYFRVAARYLLLGAGTRGMSDRRSEPQRRRASSAAVLSSGTRSRRERRNGVRADRMLDRPFFNAPTRRLVGVLRGW